MAGSEVENIADLLYRDALQQWTEVKSTIEGWSSRPTPSSAGGAKNQAQSASDWIAATADLTGRLSLIWLKSSWIISRRLIDAMYATAGRNRSAP